MTRLEGWQQRHKPRAMSPGLLVSSRFQRASTGTASLASQCRWEDKLQDWKRMPIARYDGRRIAAMRTGNLTGAGGRGMRACWWACICVGVFACSAAYQHFKQTSLPTGSAGVFEQTELHVVEQESEQPLTYKDEGRLHETDATPTGLEPDQLPNPQKEARLEDAADAGTIDRSEPNDTKQNLSYLAFYAYSEIPPETKPADIVLSSLKKIPPGTPVDEIKWVSAALGLDFTFMKTVAKVESGFNPKQRTGSYVGLFQLSKHEFQKYGAGDIFVPRDNTVAAALKFMTEAILFEMFTHKKPSLNDLYLIHQQGIDGAAEHVSHPRRLAWRSMCATDEGKEKGERWCKLAIWGNAPPEVKRIWKNVNKVTSGAFVAMWQQRVSHFYTQYSQAVAN
jgi:hypothetical protein